jgi:ketosteroid isomerase-like protein
MKQIAKTKKMLCNALNSLATLKDTKKMVLTKSVLCNNTIKIKAFIKTYTLKNIIGLILAILMTGLLHAQELSTENKQAVQRTIINAFDALSKKDSLMVKEYCATDILLFENGATWNLDTLIRKAIILNTAPDFKRTNSFEFINTTVNKNVAWVTYNLSSEVTRDGKQSAIKWLETVVLVKEKNHWKIKVLHSTLIKRS